MHGDVLGTDFRQWTPTSPNFPISRAARAVRILKWCWGRPRVSGRLANRKRVGEAETSSSTQESGCILCEKWSPMSGRGRDMVISQPCLISSIPTQNTYFPYYLLATLIATFLLYQPLPPSAVFSPVTNNTTFMLWNTLYEYWIKWILPKKETRLLISMKSSHVWHIVRHATVKRTEGPPLPTWAC